eukprot:422926-Prymnesium_polylepis.1
MSLDLQQVYVGEVRTGHGRVDGPRRVRTGRTDADGCRRGGRTRTGADGSVHLLHNNDPKGIHVISSSIDHGRTRTGVDGRGRTGRTRTDADGRGR